jgi:hypothetical protein
MLKLTMKPDKIYSSTLNEIKFIEQLSNVVLNRSIDLEFFKLLPNKLAVSNSGIILHKGNIFELNKDALLYGYQLKFNSI